MNGISMFLLILIFGWIYPTFFSILYLLKNRKKIQDVVETKLQFSQMIFGIVMLIGTFQTEGFAHDEMAIKCIGWNVWFAIGAGKISWINMLALITCEQITGRNKLWWWAVFIFTNVIQITFYVAVITSDTAHKTINNVCFLRHDYEALTSAFIIGECAAIACSSSIWQTGKIRITMIITCLFAGILFLPGVIHFKEFMFEYWWRIITIISNLIPIVFWHSQRTWYIAYLFAKHRSIRVWLSMKEQESVDYISSSSSGSDSDDDDKKDKESELKFISDGEDNEEKEEGEEEEEEEEEEIKNHFVYFLNSGNEEAGEEREEDVNDIVDEYYHPDLSGPVNSFHLAMNNNVEERKKKTKFFANRRKKKKN